MPDNQIESWGKVRRLFEMTCGVCGKSETIEHTNYDGAIELLCSRQWRVSANHGFIHRQCEKQMPAHLKFT